MKHIRKTTFSIIAFSILNQWNNTVIQMCFFCELINLLLAKKVTKATDEKIRKAYGHIE